jgi:hypothetical protein
MAYIFSLVWLIRPFFKLMFSVISHKHQLQLFWFGGILDHESNNPIRLFQMHLIQCSHYILLNFGIICQLYGCCNYQHLLSMYITQLDWHLNGITLSKSMIFFDEKILIFLISYLFLMVFRNFKYSNHKHIVQLIAKNNVGLNFILMIFWCDTCHTQHCHHWSNGDKSIVIALNLQQVIEFYMKMNHGLDIALFYSCVNGTQSYIG